MSDERARDQARDVLRNIHLQAPAGSGKTTVLAQRFLAALAVADEPEEVLAITFTRKAAGEMRERVLAALDPAASMMLAEPERWGAMRDAVHAQAARRDWRLEELPQRLRIQTIDSLSAELARAMPVLGRMQASLRVVDDATALFDEAARRTLTEGDRDAEAHADIDLLMRRLDNNMDRARDLLSALLPGRNRWQQMILEHSPAHLASAVQASLERIVADAIAKLRQSVSAEWILEAAHLALESSRNLASRGDDPATLPWLQAEAALSGDPAHLRYWQALAPLLLVAGEDRLRSQVNVRNGFPPAAAPLKQRWQRWRDELDSRAGAVDLLAELRALPAPLLEEGEQQVVAALARLLLLAAAQLKLLFRERGMVDHSEVAAIARQALRSLDEQAEFPLRQTLRVAHLLVDECQDVSPDQVDLVRALTAGWQRGDRRSLFLVGDPMQSIYLFRGSEVGLFLRIRNRGVGGIGLEALQLTRNFRSQRALVEWVNGAFARIFPAQENLRSSAVTFLAAAHARSEDPRLDAAVTVWPQRVADAQVEATQIAMEIRALRAREPSLSIAVLVQTRAVAEPVLRALQVAGIATAGVDLAALADRPVVRDLVALGQALLDAGNRSAWLAVLRSPPCGFTLDDLLVLCEAAGEGVLVGVLQAACEGAPADALQMDGASSASMRAHLQRLSADGALRLSRVARVLHAAWSARGSRDVAGNIEQCWQALGGEAACIDALELATARQYLLALRRLQETEGIPTPERLQDLATRLRDRNSATGTLPVEVLTIHRAKGLEWDVVFVPGLGKRPRSEPSPLLRWLELPHESGADDLLLAVRSIGSGALDPMGAYINRLQSGRLLHERQRLLYVAVTRARLRLYLSGFAARDPRDGRPKPAAKSLLDLLWPAVGAEFAAAFASQPAVEEPAGDDAPLRMLWHRLPSTFAAHESPALPVPASMLHRQQDAAEQVEFSWVGPLARAAGTVMHAELERLAHRGQRALAELPGRVAVCEVRLREQGIAPDAARRASTELIARLSALADEPHARWLLFTPHRGASTELPLSGLVGGELRNVVIDRMFIDEHGTRWIIDFKTGVHAGSGLAEFLQRELERYTPQLRLYARLAASLGPEPVRAALYFPWLGELAELPQAI